MKQITLPEAAKLTSPNPVTLVCTQKPDGTPNLATVSWWTYLSFHPDMIAFAMAKTSYTGERMRESKKAAVTIPGAEIDDIVLGCGTTSGRDTNKAEKFGIELEKLADSGIEIPVHTRAAIACELKETCEVGDHYLYICYVTSVYGESREPALFAWDGYAELATARKGSSV